MAKTSSDTSGAESPRGGHLEKQVRTTIRFRVGGECPFHREVLGNLYALTRHDGDRPQSTPQYQPQQALEYAHPLELCHTHQEGFHSHQSPFRNC